MPDDLTTPPPPSRPKRDSSASHPVHKTLASAANLANLLPTGTVLAFRTLAPSFSNHGFCKLSNKYLTGSLVMFCSIICFLSSFTDSFVDSDGKLYYGLATINGLYIFNGDDHADHQESSHDQDDTSWDFSKFRIRLIDFVHAFVSLFVFLVYAFCDGDLQKCFFPLGGEDLDVLVMNLPLAAGVFSSFFFMIFPTTRRGVGYSDMQFGNYK